MKVGELLRTIADVADKMEQGQGNPTELDAVEVPNADDTDSEAMVSPLQQKHEMLKKVSGVDNNVDDFAADAGEYGCEPDTDELTMLKKAAGINPAGIVATVVSGDHEAE